jgi:hypothetical protein
MRAEFVSKLVNSVRPFYRLRLFIVVVNKRKDTLINSSRFSKSLGCDNWRSPRLNQISIWSSQAPHTGSHWTCISKFNSARANSCLSQFSRCFGAWIGPLSKIKITFWTPHLTASGTITSHTNTNAQKSLARSALSQDTPVGYAQRAKQLHRATSFVTRTGGY